jgi:phospholipase C
MTSRHLLLTILTALLFCTVAGCAAIEDKRSASLNQIETIVVIYAENRSFDNLYGLFPGANGIFKNADGSNTDLKSFQQLDRDGVTPLATLPAVWNAEGATANALAFIATLPNAPFRIDTSPGGLPNGLSPTLTTPDLTHRFYTNQMQLNDGRNTLFAAWSDAGGLTMGYYDGSSMRMWPLAQQYTLADNFFMGAFGGSFLNHFWLVCACTPLYTHSPTDMISSIDDSGVRLKVDEKTPSSALNGPPVYVNDRNLTPDGYAVDTTQPPYQPSKIAPALKGDPRLADQTKHPLPAQDSSKLKTIGDTLSAKQVSWAWYAGAWNQALRSRSVIDNKKSPNFQTHHQPFNYFSRFDPTTEAGAAERAAHLKDYSDLQKDLVAGRLPAVVFYKPQGNLNQHPGYTDVMSGDAHIAELVAQLQKSPQWPHMAIIVTYDENGGYWDHVPPPKGDRWGPGSRIPALIISPFAKTHYVDHSYYDTTSILKFISKRFDLAPLPGVRPNAGDLSNAFNL